MKQMKELPEQDRPYEKCCRYGAGALTDTELLAVILRTGTRGESALELSARLLSGAADSGLLVLYHMTMEELMAFRGIGKVKAVQLKCIGELSKRIASLNARRKTCFTSAQEIASYYMEDSRHEEQENVRLLLLDPRGGLIDDPVISRGTADAALVNPREIFMTAVRRRAVSVIIMHNHPSGDPTPSDEDIELTGRIRACGDLMGIRLLDHIIIGDLSFFSFRNEGML